MKADSAKAIIFTQELEAVTNYSSDIIALEDAFRVSVQFSCPGLPLDADFDTYLMISNDGTTWFYQYENGTALGLGASTLRSAAFPDDAKLFQGECHARFVKVLIENYAIPATPTTVIVTVCIKD